MTENGGGETQKWKFKGNEALTKASGITVRGVLDMLMDNLNPDDNRLLLRLGHGDPSHFPCFYTTPSAEYAVVDALRSRQFNCYSSSVGILPARQAVAEYLSRHLPNKLSPDDVFLTLGCTHAIEVALSVLAHPGANILLPRPGYPYYEAMSSYIGLENRHFNLLPEKGWEVDLDAVEALADENTVAMVIINPGNPCGNVYTYEHLQKVAETAKKLGILVIADEVYEHLTFGNNPFVPMGVFGHTVPVLTLGSISKRWIVPGWRVGWLVTNDTQGILQESGLVESITSFLNISSDPATFIQVKLNLCLLSDIQNDLDFCKKLAKEENMVILPGSAVGMKNWVRITFAVEPSTLEQGLERIKAFSLSHAK
ncbi:S-alkyl-thiohydroximate lyase SUR1 isoform X3 [Spinacia oleracea]|uniref:S-alkyl-thiohydroximate lyase SUR1 isoform X3 n=1 Tax=Spinacia oleracea TaxID=3562 RepID=A0ABM3RUU7_SPIOL|nr:S-alkyl-thiohydroximate lyase SUR1-like isoform X3 [Spinacia oleracea]